MMKGIQILCIFVFLVVSIDSAFGISQKDSDKTSATGPTYIQPGKQTIPYQTAASNLGRPSGTPDLKVESVRVTWLPGVRDRSIMIPLEIVISNIGDIGASNFNVVANVMLFPPMDYAEGPVDFVPNPINWNFYVSGEENYRQSEYEAGGTVPPEIKYNWCGIICNSLSSGETKTYTGSTYFRDWNKSQQELHGWKMVITAFVNTACSNMDDDLFMRLRESNYENNQMTIEYTVPPA
jgi:hypothetical protein